MLPIPEDYISSICEIRSMENDLIATGIIREITEEYIQVNRKHKAMSLVRYGTPVKINIFNYRKGIRVVTGVVFTSNLDFIKVVELTTILDSERRNFFRVDTNLNAKIVITKKSAENQEGHQKPQEETLPVQIRNLSLGGVLFATKHELKKGERIKLEMDLGRTRCSFKCAVGRIEEKENDVNLYGCRFTDAKERESSALCAYIFQRQKEQINDKEL